MPVPTSEGGRGDSRDMFPRTNLYSSAIADSEFQIPKRDSERENRRALRDSSTFVLHRSSLKHSDKCRVTSGEQEKKGIGNREEGIGVRF